MKSWKSIAIAIIALVVIGNWIATRNEPVPRAPSQVPPPQPVPSAGTPSISVPPAPENPPPPAPGPAAPQPAGETPRASTLRDLEDPLVVSYPPSTPPPRQAADAEPEVAVDFDKVSLMLRDYRSVTGENPVGTNAEIIKALNGGNPKGAQLGPSEGQGLNANGELIDRWGTPYFFHQLTKDLMEIHSAGPDRRMGTGDDIISR